MRRDPLQILVVEDDAELACAIVESLRGEGHVAAAARDRATALAHGRTVELDAVLLDLWLGDASGFELARELRGEVLRAGAVIILVTGDARACQAEADAAGIDLVVTKPVTHELLAGLVGHLLSLRQRGRLPRA